MKINLNSIWNEAYYNHFMTCYIKKSGQGWYILINHIDKWQFQGNFSYKSLNNQTLIIFKFLCPDLLIVRVCIKEVMERMKWQLHKLHQSSFHFLPSNHQLLNYKLKICSWCIQLKKKETYLKIVSGRCAILSHH